MNANIESRLRKLETTLALLEYHRPLCACHCHHFEQLEDGIETLKELEDGLVALMKEVEAFKKCTGFKIEKPDEEINP